MLKSGSNSDEEAESRLEGGEPLAKDRDRGIGTEIGIGGTGGKGKRQGKEGRERKRGEKGNR